MLLSHLLRSGLLTEILCSFLMSPFALSDQSVFLLRDAGIISLF